MTVHAKNCPRIALNNENSEQKERESTRCLNWYSSYDLTYGAPLFD